MDVCKPSLNRRSRSESPSLGVHSSRRRPVGHARENTRLLASSSSKGKNERTSLQHKLPIYLAGQRRAVPQGNSRLLQIHGVWGLQVVGMGHHGRTAGVSRHREEVGADALVHEATFRFFVQCFRRVHSAGDRPFSEAQRSAG